MKAWALAGAAGFAALLILLPRYSPAPWAPAEARRHAVETARRLQWDISGWTFEITAQPQNEWRQLKRAFPRSDAARALPSVRYRVFARPSSGQATFAVEFGEQGQLLALRRKGDAAHPLGPLPVESLPGLFAPGDPGRYARWVPGQAPVRRPPDLRKRRDGRPPAGGGPRRERPTWFWEAPDPAPADFVILTSGPDDRLEEARLNVELPKALREAIRPAGETAATAASGFGGFLLVLATIFSAFQFIRQIGIRRDYLMLGLRVAVVAAALLTALLLLGGPMSIVRHTGWEGSSDPRSEGSVWFGIFVGRPFAFALPLAAGFLLIRGGQIRAWLGVAGAALRGHWYVGHWRAAWAGAAGGAALSALAPLLAWLGPEGAFLSRPALSLVYHPFPAFAVLRDFTLASYPGLLLFAVLFPLLLKPDRISRFRLVLLAGAGFFLMASRGRALEDQGWLMLAYTALWLAGSWLVFHRLGLTGLLAAWLTAMALPLLAVFLGRLGGFWLPAVQMAAVCALPGVGVLLAARRPGPAGDEDEFAAEIERRNHPATAPRLRSEREHLLSEFALAREAQEGMLPAQPPEVPGYSIGACCLPAREVGGDLFDFLPFPGGRLGLCVADVSGKGVPAALYMTLTKGMLSAEQDIGSPPHTLARTLNAQLLAAGKRRTFVTLILAVLDPASGEVELVRAGHNPALLWSAASRTAVHLQPGGIGLGLAADSLFHPALESRTFTLGAGDILVLYSDGLTEAMNRRDELFGEGRLIAAVTRLAHLDAGGLTAALRGEVETFAGGAAAHDDLTLVVLKREDGAGG